MKFDILRNANEYRGTPQNKHYKFFTMTSSGKKLKKFCNKPEGQQT